MDLAKTAVKLIGTALLAAGVLCSATAATIVYDFDTFDDNTALTGQYAGLTFAQSTVLKAGQSLNELVFPPHSADNVLSDDGGPITVVFSTLVFGVGGYFTYLSGLAVAFYDVSNVLLGALSGAFTSNYADSAPILAAPPTNFSSLPARQG